MTTISPAKVTADELSLSWPAATDNRRVIGYRIWLNGYEVATTAETRATLRWFNDDEGQHVVQIKAIDAAGNQSTVWSTLLVTRPSPEPTASDAAAHDRPPTPTPTPTPTESPSVARRASRQLQADQPSAPDAASPSRPPPASDLGASLRRRARWSSSPTAPCCSRSTIRPPTRAGSPSRRSPSWSGRRSTSTPTG